MSSLTSELALQTRRAVKYAMWGLGALVAWAVIGLAFGGPGPWFLAAVWVVLCLVAAIRRHTLIWGALVVFPLALICLQWVTAGYPVKEPDEDPFGIQFATIGAFIFAAFVTAASGTILLIAAWHNSRTPSASEGTVIQ